jgi:hypothetical protein
MPVVQSTYRTTLRPGLEGQIATEYGGDNHVETRIAEGTAGLPFGRVVSLGTGERGAVIGGAIGDMLGVTVRDITLIAKAGETADVYQNGDNTAVLNEGDIWVLVNAGVTAGDSGTYLAADGTLAPAASGVSIPGSRWLTTAASSGDMACLRLTQAYHNT